MVDDNSGSVRLSQPQAQAYLEHVRGLPSLTGKRVVEALELGPAIRDELVARGASEVVSANVSQVAVVGSENGGLRQFDGTAVAGDFDVALAMVDASHHANGAVLAARIMSHVKHGGAAWLEFPTAGTLFEHRTVPVLTRAGFRTVPTFNYIRETILRSFAARDVGWPPQEIRNLRSIIFKCVHKAPIVILLGGESGVGKTTLAATLGSKGCRVLHFDYLFSELLHLAHSSAAPELDFFRRLMDSRKIGTSIDRMIDEGHASELSDLLLNYFSPCDDLTVAEGYLFRREEIRSAISESLRNLGFRVHLMTDVT